jgi:hypothetical protein
VFLHMRTCTIRKCSKKKKSPLVIMDKKIRNFELISKMCITLAAKNF